MNTQGTSADISTVNGFTLGAPSGDDTLTFNAYAWDHGNATVDHGGLVGTPPAGLL